MDGKRFELSKGVFVSKSEWDENAQVLSGRSEKVGIINNCLEKFVSRIFDLYNQLEAKGEDFDISYLKDKLTGIKPKNGLLNFFNKVIISIEAKPDKGYSLGLKTKGVAFHNHIVYFLIRLFIFTIFHYP